jgi:hypothetical protein
LPQANGWACVDFGYTYLIGLFWNLLIYLLGFFSNYECWVTDLIMSPYHFIFWVVTCLFVSWGFIWLCNVKNNSYDYYKIHFWDMNIFNQFDVILKTSLRLWWRINNKNHNEINF